MNAYEFLFRPSTIQRIYTCSREKDPGLALKLKDLSQQERVTFLNAVNARIKAEKKLPTLASHKAFIFPDPSLVEQATSEKLALYKSKFFSDKTRLIDLSAGLGADLIFSDCESKIAVEKNELRAQCLRHNLPIICEGPFDIIHDSAENYMGFVDNFNSSIFYVDPARRDENNLRNYDLRSYSPDLGSIINQVLEKGGSLLAKISPMVDLKMLINTIEHLDQIHILALNRELKEIILKIDSDSVNDPAITLHEIGHFTGKLSLGDTNRRGSKFAEKLERYVLDPLPVVRKVSPWDWISESFSCAKVSVETHVFTADKSPVDFPGDCYEVLSFCTLNEGRQKYKGEKCRLLLRNVPFQLSEAQKKLGIIQGEDRILMLFTAWDGKLRLAELAKCL